MSTSPDPQAAFRALLERVIADITALAEHLAQLPDALAAGLPSLAGLPPEERRTTTAALLAIPAAAPDDLRQLQERLADVLHALGSADGAAWLRSKFRDLRRHARRDPR